MKALGVPRVNDAEDCDKGDGQSFARKASVVNLPGRGGDIRSNFKKPERKQAIRRLFAKMDRAAGKHEAKQLND